jgi:hypothetical protein
MTLKGMSENGRPNAVEGYTSLRAIGRAAAWTIWP